MNTRIMASGYCIIRYYNYSTRKHALNTVTLFALLADYNISDLQYFTVPTARA